MTDKSLIIVTVNGKGREVLRGSTIESLLAGLELDKARIAVEVNREIVRKADYAGTVLRPGDSVEIVTFVGGG